MVDKLKDLLNTVGIMRPKEEDMNSVLTPQQEDDISAIMNPQIMPEEPKQESGSPVLEELLGQKEQPRMSKKIMSRMPSEPSANAQEANMLNQMAQQEVEEVSEADRLAKQIDQAKPESVKSAVKEKLAQKKEEAKSPYEDILAQIKELQEGSKGDSESARKKDALLGFLNTLNQSLGKYDQAAASRAARTPMEMLKQVQVKSPEFARQAKEDQQTAYGRLLNQLSMARAEEKEKTDLSEKEKDRQLKRELAQQDREAKLEQTIAKAAEKSQGLTEGQKAVDKAFAKDYADYVAGGGFAQAQGDIGRLDEVLKDISDNKDMFTGPLDKLVETSGGIDWVRSVVNPRLQDVKDRLEQIIQQDLRKTLGAQFTEKEGKQFLERSFNPKLGAEENIKRIKSFISDVKKRAEQKERAIKEYESKGTLKDFKGNVDKQPKEEKAVNEVRKRDPKSGRVAVFDADTKKFLRYE